MRDAARSNPSTNGARRYTELKELGRGGMGRVALVRDQQIGRNIAMKQLLRASSAPDEVTRFVREAQATGQLEHPNIVPIYDIGVAPDNSIFFTMKYVRGESLGDVLARRKVYVSLQLDAMSNPALRVLRGAGDQRGAKDRVPA